MDKHNTVDAHPSAAFINLVNGVRLDLLDPDPAALTIDAIARGLSRESRFAGQTYQFYSVAEHCLWLSALVEPEHAFVALMHDAAEAFIKDLPSPVKKMCPEYRLIENRLWSALCQAYKLPEQIPEAVHIADHRLQITEARDMMPGDDWKKWYPGVEPFDLHIIPLAADPRAAEEAYINRFTELRTAYVHREDSFWV